MLHVMPVDPFDHHAAQYHQRNQCGHMDQKYCQAKVMHHDQADPVIDHIQVYHQRIEQAEGKSQVENGFFKCRLSPRIVPDHPDKKQAP